MTAMDYDSATFPRKLIKLILATFLLQDCKINRATMEDKKGEKDVAKT